MKTKQFQQKVVFKAAPEDVYNALMDSKKHSAFSGGEAVIGKKTGDAFSSYNGYIEGKNIELIPGKKIVQTWKALEDDWPDDHWSTVEFVFNKTKNGTELEFTHKNIPATVKADFEKGWFEYYWDPMKAMLEK